MIFLDLNRCNDIHDYIGSFFPQLFDFAQFDIFLIYYFYPFVFILFLLLLFSFLYIKLEAKKEKKILGK